MEVVCRKKLYKFLKVKHQKKFFLKNYGAAIKKNTKKQDSCKILTLKRPSYFGRYPYLDMGKNYNLHSS